MAFIASTQTPDSVYNEVKIRMLGIKRLADRVAAEFAGGGASNSVLAVLDNLVAIREQMDSVTAVPGIQEYAQIAENDPAYDVIAEFTAVRTAVVAAIDEIRSTYPVSAGGYAEEFEIGQGGARVYRLFSAAQLSGLVTALQNISAQIA